MCDIYKTFRIIVLVGDDECAFEAIVFDADGFLRHDLFAVHDDRTTAICLAKQRIDIKQTVRGYEPTSNVARL